MRIFLWSLALLLTAAPLQAQSLTYYGHPTDCVGAGRALAPDGVNDAIFGVTLPAAATLSRIVLRIADGPEWDTLDPSAPILAVRASVTAPALTSPYAVQAFVLCAWDTGTLFAAGRTVNVYLTETSGATLQATLTIPVTPMPLPAPPPSIPVPPPTPDPVPLGDTIPPTVSVRFPKDGVTYPETKAIVIIADASDNVEVASMQLYVNGAKVGGPSEWKNVASAVWDTRAIPNGTYTILAEATDTAGNIGRASIRFTVQN